MSPTPTERLYAIVEQGLCIGCGLCEAIAPESITVRKTTTGFEVPVVIGDLDDATVDRVYDICPGTRLEGLPDRLVEDDTVVDPVWGPVRRIVRAWAGDPEVRHIGSTGGSPELLLSSGASPELLTSGVPVEDEDSTMSPVVLVPSTSPVVSPASPEASGSSLSPQPQSTSSTTAAIRKCIAGASHGRRNGSTQRLSL